MGWFSRTKKRRVAIEEMATKLQMSFTLKDEYGIKALLKDFRIAKRGHSHRVRYILQKREEQEDTTVDDFRILDYHYVIQAGNSPVPVMHTVFFVQSKQLELPAFRIEPRSFFHRVGQFLGFRKNQISFPDFPEFAKRYVVKGEDEVLIRQAIRPDLIKFLLAEKRWVVEGIGYYLIFYYKSIPPRELKSFYEKGKKVFHSLQKRSN